MNASHSARVALVTGGSGGSGRDTALRLAADGMAVAVHYSGNRDAAETVAAEIIDRGGRALTVAGDVASEADMSAAFDAVEEGFGGIDVVVNTAGVMRLGPIAEFSLDDFDRIMRTNVRGAFVVSQHAARCPLRARRRRHRELLHQRHPHAVPELRAVRRLESRRRELHSHPCLRTQGP